MKTKRKPARRRKKAAPHQWLVPKTTTASNMSVPGQTVWYPTLTPRKTTWVSQFLRALSDLFTADRTKVG